MTKSPSPHLRTHLPHGSANAVLLAVSDGRVIIHLGENYAASRNSEMDWFFPMLLGAVIVVPIWQMIDLAWYRWRGTLVMGKVMELD